MPVEDGDAERETMEIHEHSGTVTKFANGNRKGVNLGSISTGGLAPGLNMVLTKQAVVVVEKPTGDEIGRADIDFNYQWYDHNDEPVDSDDPTAKRGEQTEPKEGAVKEARERADDIASGFLSGWRRRHRHGIYYDIQDYVDELKEMEWVEVLDVDMERDNPEIELHVTLPNPDWGLPSGLLDWIDDHPTIAMKDIGSISSESVTLYLDRDTSRRPRY